MSKHKLFNSKVFLKNIPHRAGVYRMIGTNNKILYIGKAKDLRQRLGSYFSGSQVNSRIWSMIKQIIDIQITLTETEAEALLLESNLIKKHKTRYNVLLRDDKSYPYIYLSSQHMYPQLCFQRNKSSNAKGEYFGPYPNANAVRETLTILQKLFRVRQCEDSYFAHRSRPCLQYQIKRCSAPCTQMIKPQDYQQDVQYSQDFLQGKSQPIIDKLVQNMEQAAQQQQFEYAADCRDRIETLRQISQQQYIQSGSANIDVIALCYASNLAAVQVITIRQGHNLGNKNFFPSLPNLDMCAEEILSAFMAQYYLNHQAPQEILSDPKPADYSALSSLLNLNNQYKVMLKYRVQNTRKHWLAMAQQNAYYALQQHLSSQAGIKDRLIALKKELSLSKIPMRMECFDISHTMGEATVASCVVFTQEGAVKSEYRRFNIQGISAGDDYAAMRQVLQRRFQSIVEHADALDKKPDMVFIDGGKGQVQQALDVLQALHITGITVIGVAKGEGRKVGLETLITHQGTQRKNLSEHSKALHLIQQIRDEAHRFAITAHRQKRHKARLTSPLEGITGLGVKRRQLLLKQFGGIRALSRASVEEISKIKGISITLAQRVYNTLYTI
jgi:excinuclease ABC subunit C